MSEPVDVAELRPVLPRRAMEESLEIEELVGQRPPMPARALGRRASTDEPDLPADPRRQRPRRGGADRAVDEPLDPEYALEAHPARAVEPVDEEPAGDGPTDAGRAAEQAPEAAAKPAEKGGALARKAASGARITVLGQIVRFVVQITGIVLMSRMLTPSEVGLVAMVTAIVNIAEIIRDFGLSSAAVQAKDVTNAERSNLFWVNLGIGSFCGAVVAASSGLMASFYGEPRVQAIALALAGVFVLSGANTQLRADLSRTMRFSALAISDVLAQVIAVGVSLYAASQGASYWSVVLQQFLVVAVGLTSNAIQCRWIPGWYDRTTSIKRFVDYGKSVLGTNLLGYALNNVDNVGLSYVWGKEVVGLYSRAFNLLQMPMTQINAPLGRVALPVLSRVQEDRKELQRYFVPFQRAVCYVLGLMFGMMAALADPLVRIMLGPSWRAAGPILTILAIGGVFKVMDSASYQVWLATGKTKELLRFYLWTRPVMMALILGGLPWGSTGVAWSGTLAAGLHWLVATWYMGRRTGLQPMPLYRTAATSLLCVVAPASVAAWFATGLVANAFAQLLVGGLAGLAVVALIALAVPGVRRDLRQLGQMLTMRRKK